MADELFTVAQAAEYLKGGAEKKLVFKSFWWQIGNKSIFFSSVQVRKAV